MLFGHQDDAAQTQSGQVTAPDGSSTDSFPLLSTTPSDAQGTQATDNPLDVSAPLLENPLSDETVPAAGANPALDTSTPQLATNSATPSDTAAPATNPDAEALLNLKKQALGELTPLVDHLEQTPEEKFRTTMMMIQSTDNQALIKEAFAAAQAIPDDKARAQALLDVINEINYFTQQKQ